MEQKEAREAWEISRLVKPQSRNWGLSRFWGTLVLLDLNRIPYNVPI